METKTNLENIASYIERAKMRAIEDCDTEVVSIVRCQCKDKKGGLWFINHAIRSEIACLDAYAGDVYYKSGEQKEFYTALFCSYLNELISPTERFNMQRKHENEYNALFDKALKSILDLQGVKK